MHLITTSSACADFCRALSQEPFVTVDTEFMRERTYYAKLCLIQLGGSQEAAAIDPLAEGMDLSPVFDLLANPKVLKVFHAARQDIEIFVNLTGKVPSPIFDTQIAATVCGFGEAASYETLATTLAKAKIDKSSRFTDWSRRPLSDHQLDYAIADVTHLRTVYSVLVEKLEKTKRTDWIGEEMAVLTSLSTYQTDPAEIWKRLKFRCDKPKACAVLREVAAWREKEAQRHDIPRARIIKDESLMEIALHPPKTIQDLAKIRGLPSGFAEGKLGPSLLEAVCLGVQTPLADCPVVERKKTKPKNVGAILELLKVLLHQVSEEQKVASRLIATSDELENLACEEEPASRVLSGWRYELFGKTAMALKRGELSLAVRKNKIVTLPL